MKLFKRNSNSETVEIASPMNEETYSEMATHLEQSLSRLRLLLLVEDTDKPHSIELIIKRLETLKEMLHEEFKRQNPSPDND